MVESAVLIAFALSLVAGMLLGLPLELSLFAGLVLFVLYGAWRGNGLGELARMALRGPRTIGSVIVLFVVIGALTASWRAAGTIPAITCWSSSLVSAATLVPVSFALCCAMSLLTGSSFATAATVGVICMTVAEAMGANTALVGGAIMSGSFFGDRCSPLSSAAVLVATLTGTQVFDNVRRMVRTAMPPTLASLAAYALLGLLFQRAGEAPSFFGAFSASFDLSWYVYLPMAVILVLSLMKRPVVQTMLASLACSLVLCVVAQGTALTEIPGLLLFGYRSGDPALARMVNGGGILSMGEIALIITIASTYSGIFEETGLLTGLRDYVNRLASGCTPFLSVLLTSIVTCAISCDQVVAIMLTAQLCSETEGDGSALALDLENSAAIIPAVVPWSTSCIGLMAFVGMPMESLAYTFLPCLIPLWTLALSVWERRHPEFVDGRPARMLGLDERDDARRFAA